MTRRRLQPGRQRAARLRAVGVAGAVLVLTAVAGGCAGTAVRAVTAADKGLVAAPVDSLGIDAFLLLPPAEQTARRTEAMAEHRRGMRAAHATDRLRSLAAAAVRAPDDPELWLDLASEWRAVGDDMQTAACLGNAAVALRRLGDANAPLADRGVGYRRDVALRTAAARAWHHYDRGEWREGADWAQAALQLEPASQAALQIMGLLQANMGQTPRVLEIVGELNRADVFTSYVSWIMANLNQSRDRDRGALNFYMHLRPEPSRAMECFRDMGTVAERLGEWSLAREWYGRSAHSGPLNSGGRLEKVVLPRLEPEKSGEPARRLPVWLGLGRNYVTGSLSAYTQFALEQFEKEVPGPERDDWAGAAVNAAGIYLRRNPDRAWALRARGLVFANTGKNDLARDDLRRASALLETQGMADARTEAELGRLLLEREDVAGALPRLQRAVALDGQAAASWSHLGMALATSGDADGALAALTRAIELAPELPTAWYNRGLVHLHASRLDAAEADLGRAAALTPDSQEIARLLQQVKLAKAKAQR